MKKLCVFCDAAGKLTAEHVFGDWLSRIGLSQETMRHVVGPLNRSPRELGGARPFNLRVRDVCSSCNNGWMSRLESAAARILPPIILGRPISISCSDQPTIAAWAQKTVLINMLVSSEEDRAQGYGLPRTEYHEFFKLHEEGVPLRNTRFWIGRYQGRRQAMVCVTPIIVKIKGMLEPNNPQAYTMTLVLGQLILYGIRFTTPGMELNLTAPKGFQQIWPTTENSIDSEVTVSIDDEMLRKIEKGIEITTDVSQVKLAPWRTATDLPQSVTKGSSVQLPVPCGEHFVCYPAILTQGAFRGEFYAFMTSCECGKDYLVKTESNGAHFKAESHGRGIETIYEELPGEEIFIIDDGGKFVCKKLPQPACA